MGLFGKKKKKSIQVENGPQITQLSPGEQMVNTQRRMTIISRVEKNCEKKGNMLDGRLVSMQNIVDELIKKTKTDAQHVGFALYDINKQLTSIIKYLNETARVRDFDKLKKRASEVDFGDMISYNEFIALVKEELQEQQYLT